LNQTYDTTESVGVQARSDKKSMPLYSVGKQNRDKQPGIFKAHMEYKPMNVRV
jgi:hypothetical protein